MVLDAKLQLNARTCMAANTHMSTTALEIGLDIMRQNVNTQDWVISFGD